jgi:hypothetical protein
VNQKQCVWKRWKKQKVKRNIRCSDGRGTMLGRPIDSVISWYTAKNAQIKTVGNQNKYRCYAHGICFVFSVFFKQIWNLFSVNKCWLDRHKLVNLQRIHLQNTASWIPCIFFLSKDLALEWEKIKNECILFLLLLLLLHCFTWNLLLLR